MINNMVDHHCTKEPSDMATQMDLFKKFKYSNNNTLHNIVGFPLIIALFIASFFFLGYTGIFRGIRHSDFSSCGSSISSTTAAIEAALSSNRRPGFLDQSGDHCDLFDGNWLWSNNHPLYQSEDCPFMDVGFRCTENGRPDHFYSKWRWQPKDCDLPRFNSSEMLDKLRGRRVVFVGDSIGRNQWESLLCMLASGVANKNSIYEMNGNPITKHKGYLVFMFKDYNCLIEYYRAPFLAYQGSPPKGASEQVKTTLRVDILASGFRQWKHADLLIFNTGNWWTDEKTTKRGCYFQEGSEVKMNMSLETAFQKTMETLMDFVEKKINKTKTLVLFRTLAPAHFRDGTWKNGGSCKLLKVPDLGLKKSRDRQVEIVSGVISRKSESHEMMIKLLKVTNMSLQRKDGHTSIYYQPAVIGEVASHRQDCSHWCLPGVPDAWNELLYAMFLKWESLRHSSSSSIVDVTST
ncbi:protein trichome birefringence-like 11 [Carica papaya]|uniref:protein trichome birefringence-like 11 n=1 Tax=Carica papaya TaxID=3649 RepID=UPI000B8D1943|nr:protein trichome birefringence-like 11 [Carica papaya]